MPRAEHAPVALRLALAFVVMAVLAVVIVTGLAIALGGRDITAMVQERREDLTRSLRANAAATYNTGTPGWSDVDLRPSLDLAARSGTTFAVLNNQGKVVASTIEDPSIMASAPRTPITVHNQRIGTLVVSYTDRGLVDSADNLRSSLTKAVIGAAALASVLALIVALLVARRLTRPVVQLIRATRSMSEGDRDVRIGQLAGAPRELEELAASSDSMAGALSEQDQLRRDLVSDVAHELRTPVAILQANCEALLDEIVPHTPAQTASLHEEVLRLAGLVDDLQSLAGADAASLHLSLVPCDLAVIADVAVDAMATRIKAADLTITSDLHPALIDGDPVRLHQAITNVLTNAQKFTPAGGQISVDLTSGSGRARLVISDTGPGIPSEDQPHIFERFWRGDNAGKAAGSGIGLAVVAQLVKAHGGSVTVDSRLGIGTSVVLSFPLSGATPA
jgi:two-component system sensor histidine kinase BaeS